jgi:ankyrin repeat protein
MSNMDTRPQILRFHNRNSASRGLTQLAIRWTVAWTVALFVLGPSTLSAHETDQYTMPVGREFADLGPHFSAAVYGAIVQAVDRTNAAIKGSLRQGNQPKETDRLQSAEMIAGEVWVQLFARFPFNETLDGELVGERFRARYPGMITGYRPELSIYEDPVLMLDITKVVRSFARACTVNVDGTLFGTDKIIHFLNLGHIYYSTFLGALKRGAGKAEAVSEAIQLSSGNNVFLSENTFLGMFTTGIRSNADLAANYAGFKFYRNLTEEVRIGDRVMLPMLTRRGPYWRINDQVRPDSDFFTAFVTPHWNEALNPNVYAVVTDSRVRATLSDRCPDLLDWYRDERGQPLNRQAFAALEEELSTLYGEPYGYKGDAQTRVSIATTCFPADQGIGGEVFPEPDGPVRYARNALELQSGLGRQTRPGILSASRILPTNGSGQLIDQYGRSQLWWAAKHGRLEEVKRLLAEGENPNQVDMDGEGPLHAAVRWGHVEVVEVLLSSGADVGATAHYGMTPLQLAVEQVQVSVALTLLRYRANPNARDAFGRSALHDAVSRDDRELVSLLLHNGADPGAADDNGTTPLHLAAREGNAELVGALLAYRANPLARNLAGGTPYDEAKRRGYGAILRQMTDAGALRPGDAIAEVHGRANTAGRN